MVDTKGNDLDEVTIEAGHAYLEELQKGTEIPSPNQETLNTIHEFLNDQGIDTKLIAILDDTHTSVDQVREQEKQDLAEIYLSQWNQQPVSYHWESEAIQVWENDWQNYKHLQNVVDQEDSKWCDITCAALDTAMTAEKLGLTNQTKIPAADKAVTQHDKNYPLPSGAYSSFHKYDNQEESHQIQQKLHEQGKLPLPTFQDAHNLEFNPEQISNEELEDKLYQELIA